MTELTEVRCCCRPDNLIGYLPADSGLELRELNDRTWAFSSEGRMESEIRATPGFVEASGGSKKTWRETKRTWRKESAPRPARRGTRRTGKTWKK